MEDEALVAMVMRDMLIEFGFTVVGPFSRAIEATAAATDESVDAAVLDINLDGEMVYSLAEMLSARGIPFVFVTGYGSESIDGRFAHVPVLQKPIERQVLEGIFVVNGTSGNGSAIAREAGSYAPPPDIVQERQAAPPV
ncbi:MAG: response regulator [Xanthobacteraceae bacterium]